MSLKFKVVGFSPILRIPYLMVTLVIQVFSPILQVSPILRGTTVVLNHISQAGLAQLVQFFVLC